MSLERRTFIKRSLAAAGIACTPFPLTHCIQKTQRRQSKVTVITLQGTPKNRGHIHGEALRPKIQELVDIWKSELASYWSNPDEYIGEFIADTRFPSSVERWMPDLMEEVNGIAEGAGIDFDTMFAFQCVDEEWWYSRNRKHGIAIPAPDKCSVIGVYGQNGLPTYVAQNMDLLSYEDEFQVLLRIRHDDSDLESFVFSQAGLIALNGMNNHGIAECVNALLQLDQCIDGLPVAFVNRGILERETFDDAVDFVKTVKHASGQAYTIGGPERVATFECSARSVVPFEPYKNATRLYHTNHPLVNPDQSIFEAYLEKLALSRNDWYPNSEIRYQALETRIGNVERPVSLQTIKDALGSHDDPGNPVCRHKPEDGSDGFTFGCTIFELGQKPRLHLAPGPPCETPFESYAFE
jgi:predicted choloylglycine hydrolase